MRIALATWWARLRQTFWLLPSLMTVLAIGLALLAVRIDEGLPDPRLGDAVRIYSGGPAGVRTLLSTVAGSMISVTGITFSITIVALSLASTQFGPRLLNNFVRDTGNQVVLGTFIATFVYCLLVLRTVRDVEEVAFVPHLATTLALLLALASVGVLIYFIHHVAVSIQAENVVAALGRELDIAIDRLFPDKRSYSLLERGLRREDDIPADFDEKADTIESLRGGYVQTIDYDGLMRVAQAADVILRIEPRPGTFIAQDTVLVRVWPGRLPDKDSEQDVIESFHLGPQRLQLQDIEFAINQFVEIALRALSPAINDPFTAMACVDRLGASLSRLAERPIPSAYSYDARGRLRLILRPTTFAGIADAAFNQIRQGAHANAAVTIRLLEALTLVAAHANTRSVRRALLRHGTMIRRGSADGLPEAQDRQDVEERYQRLLKALDLEPDS